MGLFQLSNDGDRPTDLFLLFCFCAGSSFPSLPLVRRRELQAEQELDFVSSTTGIIILLICWCSVFTVAEQQTQLTHERLPMPNPNQHGYLPQSADHPQQSYLMKIRHTTDLPLRALANNSNAMIQLHSAISGIQVSHTNFIGSLLQNLHLRLKIKRLNVWNTTPKIVSTNVKATTLLEKLVQFCMDISNISSHPIA